jgi:hypothetical protein
MLHSEELTINKSVGFHVCRCRILSFYTYLRIGVAIHQTSVMRRLVSLNTTRVILLS